MFVFHAKERPDASSADFREADEERKNGGMLKLGCEDGVEYPVEAEDGVDEHSEVVKTGVFVAKDLTEEGVLGIWVEKTPIHTEIPDGAVDGVDSGADNEQSF